MTYSQWEAAVPAVIRADTLWRLKAYRLALFLSDLAWEDAKKFLKDRRSLGIADQLVRAAGKISSDIAQGYSRGTGRARAVFFDYALGSAREARDWYYKGRRSLASKTEQHRVELCTSIIRLILTMVSSERKNNRKLGLD